MSLKKICPIVNSGFIHTQCLKIGLKKSRVFAQECKQKYARSILRNNETFILVFKHCVCAEKKFAGNFTTFLPSNWEMTSPTEDELQLRKMEKLSENYFDNELESEIYFPVSTLKTSQFYPARQIHHQTAPALWVSLACSSASTSASANFDKIVFFSCQASIPSRSPTSIQ